MESTPPLPGAPRHPRKGRRLAATLQVAVLACAMLAATPRMAGAQAVEDVHEAIARIAGIGATTGQGTDADNEALRRLYEPGSHAPLWLDGARRPNRDAADALALLAQAGGDGLDPADYGLAALVRGRPPPGATDVDSAARWDVELSRSLLRYLRHLHWGRVAPSAVGWQLPARHGDDHDLATMLRDALAGHRLPFMAEALAPAPRQYRQLRVALARYRSLAADTALAMPLPAPARPLRRGEPYPALHALRQRLVAFGDLPSAAREAAPPRVDDLLVQALTRFQERHGLQADGVLGKATVAALNVPPAQRVLQIELAMERLRWLPDLTERRTVAINIPMFRLWAWDPRAGGAEPPLHMAVIVGRALDTQTPVLVERMRHVIFRPYWNVPRSIVLREILPALSRNPAYLQRHDMEIVRGATDDAAPLPATPANVELLRQGALRLRQRPGPNNALGLVKFIFPNDDAVYLHGTPGQALFSRTRRDFSHGCVRLEDPMAMAEWVLKDQPGWSRERIVAAMNGDRPVQTDLAQAVQVILFYTTAVAVGDALHFAEDIYRHDERLERALRRVP